jgi:glycosyltransferase involved in cell wall biosynthesis
MIQFTNKNTSFVILSFEGPDLYSQAGGLGVRVTELSKNLAEKGFETHLFFVGDPFKKSVEKFNNEKLTLYRWCQWMSKYHPIGVYENEAGKISDFENSVPPYIIEKIILPNKKENKFTIILAEEWHTVSTVINLNKLIKNNSLETDAFIIWNANNSYSFKEINWQALAKSAIITTISKYMKHLMWKYAVNALIIPNGIPKRLLEEVDPQKIHKLRHIFKDRLLLFKVGRYDPDKRWIMAIDSINLLKKHGLNPVLIVRGGKEPHREQVMQRAQCHNLKVKTIALEKSNFNSFVKALSENTDNDIIELKCYIPERILRIFYASSDAVLANSGHEPFGLVGLEVMAAKGIAITGATGEDYAYAFENSLVVETDLPQEITTYIEIIQANRNLKKYIRENAYITAGKYCWDKIIKQLLNKIEAILSIVNGN